MSTAIPINYTEVQDQDSFSEFLDEIARKIQPLIDDQQFVLDTVVLMDPQFNLGEDNIIVDNQRKRKFQEMSQEERLENALLPPQVEVSKKRNFSVPKERTELPKRCKVKSCEQHYKTFQDAKMKSADFQTLKGKSTYCPCGSPVQFWNGLTFVSSAKLSPKK
jgi:hypothetical protein